jgi:hypothetical protein
MRKVLAMFAVGAVLVGFAGSALASYHQVFRYDYEDDVWVLNEDVEMFSKHSQTKWYLWESAEGVEPCDASYVAPTREGDPPVFEIANFAHYFPWIKAHISETELIWDIFQPGTYMAKTFAFDFTANCAIRIHFGGGTFEIPCTFEPDDADGFQNGHIDFCDWELPTDDDHQMGDKMWQYSMLSKGSPGTPPDEIEVWWRYFQHEPGTIWDPCRILDWEFPYLVPFPGTGGVDGWNRAPDLNCSFVDLEDSEALHEGKKFVFYEALDIDACDSEGKYLEKFALTIFPDP